MRDQAFPPFEACPVVFVEAPDGLRGQQLAYGEAFVTSDMAIWLTPIRRWLVVEIGTGTASGEPPRRWR